MDYQHTKHYSVEEARDLLPTLRNWFEEIDALTDRIREFDEFLAPRTNQGEDLGGTAPNQMIRDMARVHAILGAFHEWDIQIMDLQKGLVGIPALLDEREVFLYWERTQPNITHWHPLNTGYADRKPLWS